MKNRTLARFMITSIFALAGILAVETSAAPPAIRIESPVEVLQGNIFTASIFFEQGTTPLADLGGFELLIQYDASFLSFTGSRPGQYFTDCNWDLFQYTFSDSAICGSQQCPSGTIRIVSIADMGDLNPPTCFLSSSVEIAQFDFIVSDDRTLECSFTLINFSWYYCGNNSFSTKNGDTSYISNNVVAADNNDITNFQTGYPTLTGAQAADCFNGPQENWPQRKLTFHSGGLDIICADSIDTGAGVDINLDGIGNDMADFNLFLSYFLYGQSVFTVDLDKQIKSTDANRDRDNLSIADLIYLGRLVTAPANIPLPSIDTSAFDALFTQDLPTNTITVSTPDTLGAVRLVFIGSITPQTVNQGMSFQYAFDGNLTRVIIYSLSGATIVDGTLMTYTGDGLLQLAETAGTSGGLKITSRKDVSTDISNNENPLPVEFVLHQNLPNPFNATTVIKFELAEATWYSLDIFDIAGRLVERFSGRAIAGSNQISWNAKKHSSGVYIYRLTAGDLKDSRRMVLLK